MSNPLIKAVVATLIQVVLISDQQSVQAEFSDTCDNSTSSLSCIHTYEQLYHSLTKSDNSFNIESALYPAKKPSSVRVFVNLHGPNKTGSPIARYTWSLSCLYVAVPALFLEIVSLGSILVRHRTKELNLTIPNFCCNVSKTEDERRKTINDMIENVLAALQDLAISPGIRNPELNNAECVIEGHGTDMQATGRSVEIRIMIWGSFCFTCAAFGPLHTMTRVIVTILRHNDGYKHKASLCLSALVGILGSCIWMLLLCLVIYFMARDGPGFFLDILIILISALYLITPFSEGGSYIWNNCRSRHRDQMWTDKLLTPLSVVYTSFCSCWMLIGIMLNPIWGLTVAVVIFFISTSFTYVAYNLASVNQSEYDKKIVRGLRMMWLRCLLAVISLTLVIIFAAQSFNGREIADDVLKTALLTALAFLSSWLSWKKLVNQESEGRQVGGPSPESAQREILVMKILQLLARVGEPSPESEEWEILVMRILRLLAQVDEPSPGSVEWEIFVMKVIRLLAQVCEPGPESMERKSLVIQILRLLAQVGKPSSEAERKILDVKYRRLLAQVVEPSPESAENQESQESRGESQSSSHDSSNHHVQLSNSSKIEQKESVWI